VASAALLPCCLRSQLTMTLKNISVCFGLTIHKNSHTQGTRGGGACLFKDDLHNGCNLSFLTVPQSSRQGLRAIPLFYGFKIQAGVQEVGFHKSKRRKHANS
jgi:hypothetical protein